MRCAKFGVAIFKASMLDCRGAICHGYISALCYIWNLCVVMVLHRSLLDWRRGKLMWCNGFVEIYAQWEGSQSDIGMCALFYIFI